MQQTALTVSAVQRMGGWQSPQVLLDTYAHFLPSELSGFADALAHPDGTSSERAPTATVGA